MIDVPVSCDVICKISYKKRSCIQRLNLSTFEHVRSVLPIGASLDLLSYTSSREFGWSRLKNITIDTENKMTTRQVASNISGVGFYIPSKCKFSFVSLPVDFLKKDLSLSELTMGIVVLDKVKSYYIETMGRGNKKRMLDLKSFINLEQFIKGAPRLLVNDKEFEYQSILDDDIFVEYLLDYHKSKMDVLLTHVMLCNNYLTPLLFTKPDISACLDGQDLIVPLESLWAFQLIYGRSYNVVCNMKRAGKIEKLDYKTAKFNMHRNYSSDFRTTVELENSSSELIVVNGLFCMRFR